MNYRLNTDHCNSLARSALVSSRRSFLLRCSITSLTFLNEEEEVEVEAAITTCSKLERDGA